MSEEPPVWLDQRSVLTEYRRVYRLRSRMDGQDTAAIDHQLSWLREQMTQATRVQASQYERAWRRAA